MKATKLPSGNYRCRVEIGVDANGKRHWKSFTAPTRKQAEKEAQRYLLLHPAPDPDTTVGAAVDRFIESKRATRSQSTIVGYVAIRRRLDREFPWLAEKQTYNVTGDDLQRMIDDMAPRLSPKTIQNVWLLVSASLKKAGMVLPDPSMPRKQRPQLHIPDGDVVGQLIEAAAGTNLEIPIWLAAFGPLRRGEICALTMEDINGCVVHVCKNKVMDEHGNWVIKPPKTYKSDRYVKMPQYVIDLIGERGYIYQGDPNLLTKQFHRFLQRNNLPLFRFHDLRHFFASYCHAEMIPDYYIMQRTGHATSETLRNVYTHTLQDISSVETEKILNSLDRVTSRVTSVSQNGVSGHISGN